MNARPSADCEEGRATILIIGFLVVVLAFLLVSASITAVHVQDRRLMTCADRVAAAASGDASSQSFYELSTVQSTNQLAWERAEEVTATLNSTTCNVGHGAVLRDVHMEGDTVVVQMTAQARIPLVPAFIGSVVEPVLTADSSARSY